MRLMFGREAATKFYVCGAKYWRIDQLNMIWPRPTTPRTSAAYNPKAPHRRGALGLQQAADKLGVVDAADAQGSC